MKPHTHVSLPDQLVRLIWPLSPSAYIHLKTHERLIIFTVHTSQHTKSHSCPLNKQVRWPLPDCVGSEDIHNWNEFRGDSTANPLRWREYATPAHIVVFFFFPNSMKWETCRPSPPTCRFSVTFVLLKTFHSVVTAPPDKFRPNTRCSTPVKNHNPNQLWAFLTHTEHVIHILHNYYNVTLNRNSQCKPRSSNVATTDKWKNTKTSQNKTKWKIWNALNKHTINKWLE